MEKNTRNSGISRKEILPAFLATVIIALVLYLGMNALQPALMNNHYICDFGTIMVGCIQGNWLFRTLWSLTDLTAATFIASVLGSICMTIVAFIAAHLERKKSKYAGTGVCGNGQVFTAMAISAIIAVFLSQVIFGRYFAQGWIPTFAAFITVQVFVTHYGAELPKLITIVALETLITFPVCNIILTKLVQPFGLPLFLAIALGIFIVVPVSTWIFNLFPWMKPSAPKAPEEGASAPIPSPSNFFVHAVFSDIGQLVVWGSSWAIIAMYVGTIISWIMNPLHPVYSAGNFPLVMFAQITTAALGIFIWYPKWKTNGFAFTFAGVVFVSAIISTYPGSWLIVIPTIIIGALVFAPSIEWVFKVTRFRGQFPAVALIQLVIFVICIVWALVVMNVLVPFIS